MGSTRSESAPLTPPPGDRPQGQRSLSPIRAASGEPRRSPAKAGRKPSRSRSPVARSTSPKPGSIAGAGSPKPKSPGRSPVVRRPMTRPRPKGDGRGSGLITKAAPPAAPSGLRTDVRTRSPTPHTRRVGFDDNAEHVKYDNMRPSASRSPPVFWGKEPSRSPSNRPPKGAGKRGKSRSRSPIVRQVSPSNRPGKGAGKGGKSKSRSPTAQHNNVPRKDGGGPSVVRP